jgi:hypothetical protein
VSTKTNKQQKRSDMHTIKFYSLTAAFIAFSFITLAQGGSKIWLTIANPSNVPYTNASGELISNDPALNNVISSLDISEVQRAIPTSRKAHLLNVYELTSYSADVVDMYTDLTNNVSVVSQVEYAPVYETMDGTDDYNTVFSEDYALDLISAQGAWDLSTGNSDIVLAISDQNYFVNHEELQGKYVYYDSTNTSSQTHGTAVAIAAAGSTNNNLGKSAIGYNSSLALYRMSYSEVLAASYAGHRVINLSWTSGCSYNQYIQDIINEVYENGTFIVAAAGNGSTCGGPENLVYPAAFDNVFAVTSVGPQDNHERTMGNASSTHQHNASVDLSAPGYDIAISAAPGWYLFGTGSSYATPLVTGTIGLMLDVNPCISNADISWVLQTSADNIEALNPDYVGLLGAGRLNARAAVEMAKKIMKFDLDVSSSVTCEANSGEIEVNIVGGNAPYTTAWSNGATGLTQSNLEPGHYIVSVTDALGCQIDTAVTIEEVTPTVFEGTIQHITCNGMANGAIDITIIDGTPDFIFEWDNGMTTEDISGLTPGTYRLKITNGEGCSVWGSYTVEQSPALEVNLEVTQPAPDQEGEIDLTVTGGTAPYTYTWNNGETSEDLWNLAPGFYEVTVIDVNGCDVITSTIVEEINVAGIDNIDGELQVSVYPNPTSDFATVAWNNEAVNTIQILNANGQVVQSAMVDMQLSYKVEDLNAGMYFINLSDGFNYSNVQKLVVR